MSTRSIPNESKSLDGERTLVLLSEIVPSPYQRRKDFDPAYIGEIAESLHEHGQINDIIVRARKLGSETYELIAGECRTRAARQLAWASLRANVVTVSDAQAAKLVLVEQLKHRAWNPLEEAEGYKMLLELEENGQRLFTLETVASEIGKGVTYVRELLAVLDAPKEMQEAVRDGRLAKRAAATVMSLVLDPEQRKQAVAMVLHPPDKKTPMTVVETEELCERFAKSLQNAPFDQKDPDLVPFLMDAAGKHIEGGPCKTCPHRSANMAHIADRLAGGGGRGMKNTGETGISPNLCTLPACFALKCQAAEESVRAKARDQGCELMNDDDAADLFDDDGNLRENIDYVAIDAKPDPTLCGHYDQRKLQTWAKLLKAEGASGGTVHLAKNPVTGEHTKVVKWQDAVKAITEAQNQQEVELTFKSIETKPATSATGSHSVVALGTRAEKPEETHGRRLAALQRLRNALDRELNTIPGVMHLTRLLLDDFIEFYGADDRVTGLVLTLDPDPDDTTVRLALGVDNTLESQMKGVLTMIFARWLVTNDTNWLHWKPWTDALKVDLNVEIVKPRKARAKKEKKLKTVTRGRSAARNQKALQAAEHGVLKKRKPEPAKKKAAKKKAKK